MPKSMKGWRKKWFYRRNDANVSLPAFTSNCLVLQPNWSYGVAKKDLSKLQPLRKVVQQLPQEGLMGMHHLRTFFSCWIQPLRQWVTKIWLYPGLSCLDHPFSKKLSEEKINTRSTTS
jgi:hypothetical protein